MNARGFSIVPASDASLLVRFDPPSSPLPGVAHASPHDIGALDRVHALHFFIQGAIERAIQGEGATVWARTWIRDVHPAASSLLVEIDLRSCTLDDATRALEPLCVDAVAPRPVEENARVPPATIAVRYDGDDLDDVAAHCGLTREDVIRLHTSALYRVAFFGFVPGFAYLHGLPHALACPRLATPRRVRAGSVAIGGAHTGVYPSDGPGGWRVIGHTDADGAASLAIGSLVRFTHTDRDDVARSHAHAASAQVAVARARGADLRVIEAGPHASLQALGTTSRAHLGFSRGGAADMRALVLANRCLGNADGALAIEATLTGPTLLAERAVTFAWSGAPGPVTVHPLNNDRAVDVPALTLTTAPAGARITCGPRTDGVRIVLAFAGGVRGDEGAPLETGLAVAIGPPAPAPPVRSADARALDSGGWRAPIRCTDAAYTSVFDDETRARFYSEAFTVTPDASRRGVRLALDPPLGRPTGIPTELDSFGVTLGAIQVPPSGQPIILGVDQTTTGGYPTLACVIAADAWRIGQLRPGATVRFAHVRLDDARRAFLEDIPRSDT